MSAKRLIRRYRAYVPVTPELWADPDGRRFAEERVAYELATGLERDRQVALTPPMTRLQRDPFGSGLIAVVQEVRVIAAHTPARIMEHVRSLPELPQVVTWTRAA